MKIQGMGRFQRAVRRLKGRIERKAVILLYHRIAEVDPDPWNLCVSPRHFAEHLEVLRQDFRPMPLRQLVQSLRHGKLPRRAVAITFDDGYADNLYNAKPLLERYDVPATFFVATGFIGYKGEFWWDELDGLVLQPGVLPEALHLTVNGGVSRWELAEGAYYSEEAFRQHRCWNMTQNDDPSPRHRLYRSLYRLLFPMRDGERRAVLNELNEWAGIQPVARPTHRTLSPEEVVRLLEGGLIEVGAHTVTHPVLSGLPLTEQRDEIRQSKDHLEAVLSRPVHSFSYPHGSRPDYTAETISCVREAGFGCACSAFGGAVRRTADYFQLPRVPVGDWDGEEFGRRLKEWFRS